MSRLGGLLVPLPVAQAETDHVGSNIALNSGRSGLAGGVSAPLTISAPCRRGSERAEVRGEAVAVLPGGHLRRFRPFPPVMAPAPLVEAEQGAAGQADLPTSHSLLVAQPLASGPADTVSHKQAVEFGSSARIRSEAGRSCSSRHRL